MASSDVVQLLTPVGPTNDRESRRLMITGRNPARSRARLPLPRFTAAAALTAAVVLAPILTGSKYTPLELGGVAWAQGNSGNAPGQGGGNAGGNGGGNAGGNGGGNAGGNGGGNAGGNGGGNAGGNAGENGSGNAGGNAGGNGGGNAGGNAGGNGGGSAGSNAGGNAQAAAAIDGARGRYSEQQDTAGDGDATPGFGRGVGRPTIELSDDETNSLISQGWGRPDLQGNFESHGARVSTMVQIAIEQGHSASVGAMQANFGTPQENGIQDLAENLDAARAALAEADDADRPAIEQEIESLETQIGNLVDAAKPGRGPEGWATVDLDVNGDGTVDANDLNAAPPAAGDDEEDGGTGDTTGDDTTGDDTTGDDTTGDDTTGDDTTGDDTTGDDTTGGSTTGDDTTGDDTTDG